MGDGMKMIHYRNILEVSPDLQECVRCWRNSKHIRHNMNSSEIISEEEHLRWISFLRKNPERQIVRLAFKEEDPFGVITLKDIDRRASRSDWGMYIGKADSLGQGYSKIMLYDLLTWAFEEEQLSRLYTSVLADNTKAMILYLNFNFHIEGRFEKHIRRESGDFVDVYWFALFSKKWFESKEYLMRKFLPLTNE